MRLAPRFLHAPLLLTIAFATGCSAEAVEGDEAEALTSELTPTQSLKAQGYVYVRRDRYRYDSPNYDGNATNHAQGTHLVTGSAARYEHPDGRIAYVHGAHIVGPVRPGVYPIVSQTYYGATRPARGVVRVRDLTLGQKGDFPVWVEVGGVGSIDRMPHQFGRSDRLSWVNLPGIEGKSVNTYGDATLGGHLVDFGATGDIVSYDFRFAADRQLNPYFAKIALTPTPIACTTPYRIVVPFSYYNLERATYPDVATCEASRMALDPYPTGAECIPSEEACR